MTREIDTSKPKELSFADRLYLQDRGQLPKGARPVTSEDLADYLERESESDGGSDVDLSTIPYVDWPKDELLAEIDVRNEDLPSDEQLKKSGTKQELADRLTANDGQD